MSGMNYATAKIKTLISNIAAVNGYVTYDWQCFLINFDCRFKDLVSVLLLI